MNINVHLNKDDREALRRYQQSPNDRDRPIYEELCKTVVKVMLEEAAVFERPFPFYFTPAVKAVRILIRMPSEYIEDIGDPGWFNGGGVRAKVRNVESPTHAAVWIENEQSLFDISPWDVFLDPFPRREVKLPEGCVKSLEEAQQQFADRRTANQVYVDDLNTIADSWKRTMERLIDRSSLITKEQASEEFLQLFDRMHSVKDENGSYRQMKLAPNAQISKEGEPDKADSEKP